MKKFLFLIMTIALFIRCTISPEKAASRYTKLSDKFDVLVDDEINEKSRKSLEKDFKKLNKNLARPKKPEDAPIISDYRSKVREKIQYLEDLKD
jgi:aconitase A